MREPSVKTTTGIAGIIKILSQPCYKEELDALYEFIGDFDYNCEDHTELQRLFNKIHDQNQRLYEANFKLLKQLNAGGSIGEIIFTKEETELIKDNIEEQYKEGA